MSEVLEFFLSNKNVIDALDSDYFYLVFKMARQLNFTEAQYRELVRILIDADIYTDKAEDDRIKLLIETFQNYMRKNTIFPVLLNSIIGFLAPRYKLGFNNETVLEIISEAFLKDEFPDCELREKNGEAWIYQK